MPLASDSNKYGSDRNWPNTIDIPNPGVGNQLEYAPPDNTVMEIIGVYFLYTALGGGVDRRPYICMNTAGGQTMHINPIVIDQPNTAAWSTYFSIGIAPVDLTIISSLTTNPMTCAIKLVASQDDRFCVRAINFGGGDSITVARIRVNQWNED